MGKSEEGDGKGEKRQRTPKRMRKTMVNLQKLIDRAHSNKIREKLEKRLSKLSYQAAA